MLAQAQLLFSVAFGEMAVILLLLFKTPLRKLLILSLDRAKRGRGPLVVKSVAATVFVLMIYTVYSVKEIQSRPLESINPTDQVLLAQQILQASLMGFVLFLSLMIDRLHHYIRELRLLRKAMEAAKKHDRGFDNGKNGGAEEVNSLKEEIASLKSKIKKLESECEAKGEEVKAQKDNSESFKGQSEKLLLEYGQLLEENQHLRSQLHALDENLSHSNGKKNT
nr:B-cell receptor-associated protein 31-like [Ipomoea batatas]GMD38487.1 B-cell receptor-associated protein 31-like [Ipomoea batatas]